jgi:hypothetical protein
LIVEDIAETLPLQDALGCIAPNVFGHYREPSR